LSCIKDTFMEYSIMTTNRCNLRCSYCINSSRRSHNNSKSADADKIIAHIIKDSAENSYDPVVITFYGGEPLLEQGLIEKIMSETAGLNPHYNIFTNGTLVSRDNLAILNKMNLISISIDGEKEKHDATRGKGSFDKTMRGYRSVKKDLKSSTLAFITATPKTRIFDSVMGVINEFDNVFWFLENSNRASGLDGFLKDYSAGLDGLLAFWMENLRAGRIYNLVPFQGLYDIIEQKHIYTGLPCGIGDNFQAIAIDGSVYSCEDSYHNRIGDIYSSVDIGKAREKYSFSVCGECEIKSICAGRCVIPHMNYDASKVRFYCECSKLLIGKFRRVLPEIKALVRVGIIDEHGLINHIARFTDVIP